MRGRLVTLRPLEEADAAALHDLRVENRAFLAPWQPDRPERESTPEQELAAIRSWRERAQADGGYGFVIEHEGRIVGCLMVSNVERGPLQSAVVGYWVAEAWNGRGFATEAVRLAVEFAFRRLRLHRIEAGVMPRNAASIRVLEKAGFREEGLMRRLLKIRGVWEDHTLFAVTNDEE